MRYFLILLVGLPLLAGCGTAPVAGGAERDGVFVHISSGPEDPHRVLMGLSMATIMHEKGRDVLVYFDVKGIGAVLEDSPDLTFAQFASSRKQIAKLVEAGVTVFACPGCLKAAGKEPDDLIPGVTVAEADAFFSFTGGRILTIDY